jgi:putative transposase
MTMITVDQIQLFDPGDERNVVERRLPHWQQAGAISFITWRTHDSMPKTVVQAWEKERRSWLVQHGVAEEMIQQGKIHEYLRPDQLREFKFLFQHRWMDRLDECHGACELRSPVISSIVADSLLHFDGKRYLLTDYVIMPNHVHLLAAFVDHDAMLSQCESWKHYTATRINRILKRDGRFWQQDGFDHLVRTKAQYRYLRDYIRENPVRARLKVDEFVHYSRNDI